LKLLVLPIGVLLALVAVILVVGVLLPKGHSATRSAVFGAPAQQLFALMDGTQIWRSTVRKYELVSEQEGRRQWRETDTHGSTITYEVTERRPSSLLRTRIVTPNLPYSGTWTLTLEPSGGGTRVRVTEQGEVYNPLFRFISRFIIGQTRTIDVYLRDLGKATGQDVTVSD
jgi:hypothetical protein